MNILKRSKLQNSVSENQKPRKFARNQTKPPVDTLYSEGVNLIIDNRRILELKDDTILLSIDIFRNHLARGCTSAKTILLPLCIGCILLASKFNEVYPPKIDEVMEALEYFGEKSQIIKIEASILKECNYQMPFSTNIVTRLQLNEKLTQKKTQQLMKIVYKCLSDPYFLKIENLVISKALTLLIENEEKQGSQNMENKSVNAVLKFIKQKTQNCGLTQRNLNKQN